MLLLLTGLALGAPEGPAPPTTTEPILDHARVDVRRVARAHAWTMVAGGAPLLLGMGELASLQYVARTGSIREGAGLAGAVIGTVALGAMFVTPGRMNASARVSHRELAAQGLQPDRLRLRVLQSTLSLLAVSALGGSWIAQASRKDSNDASLVVPAVGAAAYAGAVSIPLVQLRHNASARRAAGWWRPR